ncbi:MAG: hypothetical protein WD969_09985, partial [Paracoccaceae bacterium]
MVERRSRVALAIIAFLALGGAAFVGMRIATIIEEGAVLRAGGALAPAGRIWARIEADGLRLTLRGAAPDAAARSEALDALAQAAAAPIPGLTARIIDATTLSPAPVQVRPPAALIIMLGAGAVTITGVAPEGGTLAAFSA